MHMRVDPAGEDVQAAGIDLRRAGARDGAAQFDNRAVGDGDIALDDAVRRDDLSAPDYKVKYRHRARVPKWTYNPRRTRIRSPQRHRGCISSLGSRPPL